MVQPWAVKFYQRKEFKRSHWRETPKIKYRHQQCYALNAKILGIRKLPKIPIAAENAHYSKESKNSFIIVRWSVLAALSSLQFGHLEKQQCSDAMISHNFKKA